MVSPSYVDKKGKSSEGRKPSCSGSEAGIKACQLTSPHTRVASNRGVEKRQTVKRKKVGEIVELPLSLAMHARSAVEQYPVFSVPESDAHFSRGAYFGHEPLPSTTARNGARPPESEYCHPLLVYSSPTNMTLVFSHGRPRYEEPAGEAIKRIAQITDNIASSV
ncbi:hypothetical protein AXG93_3890s1120 [Marchantia polymorpha subsp. ruderalis]|uniref:Uncharacterized protein n=1 Tax=Marchantia polymorpha subsp. ruderalis TaxID=1480154 RepID=A0A176WFW6_MARPO|nr:hypothetical protein AXG93_3890s1120 [Marchantia polymorpha subsp. ruderalis]